MSRFVQRTFLMAVLCGLIGAPAQAQYNYPGGYGGWGGWGGGGTTVAGSAARGMGVYAAGAGAYNQQTAVARSINADTAMQMNTYIHDSMQRNFDSDLARRKAAQGLVTETLDKQYTRLHDKPTPEDIHSGEALNIVMTDLTNPKVYSQVIQKSPQQIDSQLVKNIEFQYAANMIAISLADLSERGVPDELATNPAFTADRLKVKALYGKIKEQLQSTGGEVKIDTLRECRAAVKSLQDKVSTTLAKGTPNRDEADNFLKALYGLTKMLETPAVDQFLKGLDKYPTTSLAQLITFMHSFNLRFGKPKTPIQEATYDQLYPMLASLRDRAQAGGPNPITNPVPPPDPKNLTNFFSGMDYSHFDAQPDPHKTPAPPAAGNP